MTDEELNSVPSWQAIIIDFLEEKYEADFSKYLKDSLKTLGEAYDKQGFLVNEELAFIFDTRRNRKTAEQKETDFIQEQLTKLQGFNERPTDLNFDELNSEINNKQQELKNKYSPAVWLTWAADNAKNVSFATHVPKLTHSAIDSPAFFDTSKAEKTTQLTTSSLNNAAIDGAVRGNQYAPIYQLLELERNGEKLASQFSNPETSLLTEFSENNEQLQSWNLCFAASLNDGTPRSHFLLKQVYFPLNETSIESNNYHLLCNLVSSSKAQALFEFTRRNSDESFKLRGAKKYSDETYFNFPNRASISVTASNHGNASQLNGKRGGRLGLYSCQPPVWHSQVKPPIYTTSFFYELSRNYEVQETIQYLADFLTRFENLQLSIKNPKRMRWVEEWLENLVDEVLVYVKTIQTLPAGWTATEGIKLKVEHQLLLDCYRDDEEFAALKAASAWQAIIAQDFTAWLNNQLKKADKQFTPTDSHSKLWSKLFTASFREELDLKNLTAGVEQ